MNKKTTAAVLIATLALSAAACGRKAVNNTEVDLSGATEENTMPISKDGITIKYYQQLYGNIKSYNDNEMFKEMAKITGVNIEFVSPPKGQESEQYGVMLASNDVPDIIDRMIDGIYPGGLKKGVDDGFFLDLTGYINKYAPNIKKLMEENPELKEDMDLDGKIGAVTEYMTAPELIWLGPVIRKDLLDKIGADIPRTPEELHEVLLKFKNELNIKYPMLLDESANHIPSNGIATGWNTGTNMYFGTDGRWHYGPYDEEYYKMITEFSKWYQEGLIDSEFAARDSKSIETLIVQGDAGFFWGSSGDNLKNREKVGKKNNPDFDLEPIPFLVPKRGDKANIANRDTKLKSLGAAITAKSKYPVECMKLIDYMYSPEGSEMCNYGIEGKTYTKDENGVKRYTEFFTNNPDGITENDMMYLWARNDGAYLKETNRGKTAEEIALLPGNVWGQDTNGVKSPKMIKFTDEQSSNMTTYWQDINTYVPQFVTKTIMGMSEVDSWETYKDKMQKMGMDKILEYFDEASGISEK
ncbi:MAG: extracellular solute-binding protein [Clostridiales bacterium]|nr:extracellular solute-binding protein [Clostridiales bacterium]